MHRQLFPLLLIATSGTILAQNYAEPATYGDISLVSGFLPDPHSVQVVSGGSIDAIKLGRNCAGDIASAPDLQVSYESGEYKLFFSVGSERDTTLVINQPDGSWVCDDDSGEGLNPLVELNNPQSGVYDIWVGTWGGGFADAILYVSETGGYHDYDPAQLTSNGSGFGSATPVVVGNGSQFRGRLEQGDTLLADDTYGDEYVFHANRGEEVVIDLRSNSFDTYLGLTGPDGSYTANDDYEGDTTRSMITTVAGTSGDYTVLVSSYFARETGDYTLTINNLAGNGNGLDNRFTGTLARGDQTRNAGQYVNTYEFSGSPGREVTLDLISDDFDTYLILESPSGQVWENDDLDRYGHSGLVVMMDEVGTWYAHVSSYSVNETGDYTLTISGGATSTQGERDTVALVLDQQTTGSLASGDHRGEQGEYMDYYSFTGQVGQIVRFQLDSQDFDTYLTVIQPDGAEITNDDYNGSTSVSMVEMQLPASGRYSVIVSSYWGNETGDYRLIVNSVDSGDMPFFVNRDRQNSGSQTYGIFVGISDYSQFRELNGGAGDLPFTAEDAVIARDTLLQNAGMSSANAITLLDRDATVENLRAAFHTMASKVSEDDTFVFFYSGHGGQERRAAGPVASDADGYDETLVLSNATITDDDVAGLFDLIEAGTSLIILDSCYSGGFAKDVVSKPGRMGLFSSDEDVPSLVAGKFQAGGYLSYFFRDAITDGNADVDGDSAISAMELSQYIHERYNAESMTKAASSFNTPDFGYQHLVADRGGVSHDEILFIVR